jgi:chromosome partitioning protein
VTKIIAVALQKGGVGKTTTAQHLSHALVMLGRKVLLVDLDPQGSATARYDRSSLRGTMADVLGAEGPPTKSLREIVVPTYQPNLFLAPADVRLSASDDRLTRDLEGPYALNDILRGERLPFDYAVLDTAPGKSTLLIAALVAADEIIVPVQLSPMGFEGYQGIDKTIMQARRLQARTGDVRLRLRAVVPTFYTKGEIASDSFLAALQESEHPDYEGQPLPLADPIVETTVFELASSPVQFETPQGPVQRSQTVFEWPRGGDDTPTARAQDAFYALAEMVDRYV